MKNWWLELYTIPSLKKLFRAFLIVFGVVLLISFCFPTFLVVAAIVPLYLSYVVAMDAKNSVTANIEFHKLHVNYPELRKAMLSDSFIKLAAVVLAVVLCKLVIYSVTSFGESDLILLGYLSFIHGAFLFQTMNFNKPIKGKFRFQIWC